jgi:hypothetical protein
LDRDGRTIWIVDAHGYGKRFIVRDDELLTAFTELERAIHEFAWIDLVNHFCHCGGESKKTESAA